jgi:dienelactone hydrolase
MCVTEHSQFPFIASPASAVPAGPMVLTSKDGAPFAAFGARPLSPSRTGVVVLPDNRGLSSFYEKLSVQLVGEGFSAVAIDYFGRTAGAIVDRSPDFPLMEHLMQLTRPGLFADIAAAVGYLRSPAGGDCETVFALGFCFGGRLAFLASAPSFGLAGVIGFYGATDVLFGSPGPTQLAAGLAAPILGIFGGADEGISAQMIQSFDEALVANQVEHEIVVYPGAPHSFFDIGYKEHAAACQDAWSCSLAFLRARSRQGGDG